MVALCDCSFCGGVGLGSWTVSAEGAFAATTGAGSSHGPQEANGAFSGVSADSYITGLQAGVQWDGPVTYAFPTSTANYAGGYSEPAVNNGFVAATTHQANAARDILGGGLSGPTFFKYGSFASFINLGITEVASTPGLVNSADIQIANSAQPPTAYA
ncbi:MAG: hypothetical protein FJX02_14855 [Alphaproteobacteria bacterium]|nr:hypothetical protein [Alphaproteobacteria bacterium]